MVKRLKMVLKSVNFLKKKCNHDPQFAIQKSKGADSQTLRISETLGLLFTLRNRSGINSCYAYLLKFNQRRHLSLAYIETGKVLITDRQYGHY